MEAIKFRSDMTVTAIDGYGNDALITKAARVSVLGRESVSSEASEGLLNFLMKNRHGSPFEHGSVTMLVEGPIFVFREFHRHRMGWSYNETSGRYKELEPVFYMPDDDRKMIQVGKPGAYTFEHGTTAQYFRQLQRQQAAYQAAWDAYEEALEDGVAKEVARAVLPVGIYSSMYATANPRSIMHFLSLRTEKEEATFVSRPQYEIQLVADEIEKIFASHWPITYSVWNKNGRVAP